MRILIVGAGIGGLSAALSLHAAWVGADIRVVDSVSDLRPLGVGINLLPHATRELIELGLGPELARMAVPTAEVVVMDRFGNRIWSEARGKGAGYNWPQYSVHRGELQAMLLEAVRDRLGPGSVQTSTALAELRQEGDKVLSGWSAATAGIWGRSSRTWSSAPTGCTRRSARTCIPTRARRTGAAS